MMSNSEARKRLAANEPQEYLTLDEANALVGENILFWLENPFMTPDLIAEKVRWWMTTAMRAAQSGADS